MRGGLLRQILAVLVIHFAEDDVGVPVALLILPACGLPSRRKKK